MRGRGRPRGGIGDKNGAESGPKTSVINEQPRWVCGGEQKDKRNGRIKQRKEVKK